MIKEEIKWSENIEKVLSDIGDSCQGYKWMNIFSAQRENLKYNILMYLIIASTGICGVLSSITSENYSNVLQVFVVTGTFMSSLISSIIKFGKMEQKAITYKNIAGKFASLEANIRRQLSLDRTERENVGPYLDYVSKSFDELFSATPLMPNHIYEKWSNFAETKNIKVSKELYRIYENKEIKEDIKEDIKETKIEISKPVSGVIPEMNTYSDGKMRYELDRLFKK